MITKSVDIDNTWEKRLDYALKSLYDLSALNRSSLARLIYIERLAKQKYKGRILPKGLALREVLRACIKRITTDLVDEAALSREREYLAMAEKGMSCRHISQKLGLSREHVSRFYRKNALGLLADEFCYLTKRKYDQ